MLKSILILALINAIISVIVRLFHGGKMEIVETKVTEGAEKTSYRIAGIYSQPELAFQHIEMPEGNVVDLRFSPLGFDPAVAATQLDEHIASHPTEKNYIFGISIGAMPMLNILSQNAKMIAINPFPSMETLRLSLQAEITPWAICLQVLSVALGCLALIPVLPKKFGRYSIVAWADIVWAYFTGKSTRVPDCLIVSEDDIFIDSGMFTRYRTIPYCSDYELESGVGDISSIASAPRYQQIIDEFLRKGRRVRT